MTLELLTAKSPGTWPRVAAANPLEKPWGEGFWFPDLQPGLSPPQSQSKTRPRDFSFSLSVLQVLAALQEMPLTRVLALRQQTQFLWDAYFSSVEKVMHTTLEVRGTYMLGAMVLGSCLSPAPSPHPSLWTLLLPQYLDVPLEDASG